MNKKLTEIDSLKRATTIQNLNRLLDLSHDEDEEVRFRSIEALEDYSANQAMLDRVRQGLFDSDELVRATCVELIGDWEDKKSVEHLYKCMGDKSELVRSAAITSLGQIGRRDATPFLEGKFQALSGLERVSSAIALYTLGEDKYLDVALSSLSDLDYRVRCATANLLSNFVDESHTVQVVVKLKEALLKEETKAAFSSISDAIVELESG